MIFQKLYNCYLLIQKQHWKMEKKLSLFTFWNTEIFQWVIRLCRLFFCAYDSVCFVCTVHCIYHFHFVTYVNFLKVNFAYCKKTKKSHWPWSVSSINPRQRTRTTPIHGPIYDVTTFKIKSTDRSLDKPNDKGADWRTLYISSNKDDQRWTQTLIKFH